MQPHAFPFSPLMRGIYAIAAESRDLNDSSHFWHHDPDAGFSAQGEKQRQYEMQLNWESDIALGGNSTATRVGNHVWTRQR